MIDWRKLPGFLEEVGIATGDEAERLATLIEAELAQVTKRTEESLGIERDASGRIISTPQPY